MSRLAKNVFIDKYLLLFLRIFKVSNIDKSTKKLYFLNYTVLNFCPIFPSFAFCLYDTILKYYVHECGVLHARDVHSRPRGGYCI